MTSRHRLLIVSPEPIGRVRTGVAIRLTEMARHLSATHQVTVAAPEIEEGLEFPFSLVRHSPPPCGELLTDCDVVLVHGHIGNEILAAEPTVPVVCDLYDPFVVENLAYAETLGPAVFRYDRLTLERQLRQGDFFLAASPTQRAFYLGMLTLLGRVNPATYGDGPELSRLIAVVPFGVPGKEDAPPPEKSGSFRTKLGLGDEPLLFFGGIYDWYDPILALDALQLVRRKVPDVRLLFVRNPRQETTPQTLFGRALAHAKENDLEDRLCVTDWIPFQERGAALADADVGLVAHRPGIETDMSFRTRVLDFLWAGLPVVASSGGSGSELLERAGAGRLVPPGSPRPMAEAVIDLLSDEQRRRTTGLAGQEHVLRHFAWPEVLKPLADWLQDARVDHHKPATEEHRAPSLFKRLFGG